MSTLGQQQHHLAMLSNAERDIDRIVVEHLLCAPDFRDWLLNAAGAPDLIGRSLQVEPVRGGMRGDNGLDLVLRPEKGGQGTAVLIVNRLLPSRRLAESARRAALTLVEGAVRFMLIRPEAAADRSAAVDQLFDSVITHDWLRVLFEARAASASGELALRLDHHAATIVRALDVAHTAMEAVPETSVEDFMVDYAALIERELPEFPPGAQMIKGPDPGREPLIVFPAAALPRWPFLPPLRLAHHLKQGAVSLSFGGWGPSLPDLAQLMEPVLARTPYYLALGPKPLGGQPPALLLVEDVVPVSPDRPVAQQVPSILACLQAADTLRRWFEGQRAAVRYWSELAGGSAPEDRINRYRRDVSLA